MTDSAEFSRRTDPLRRELLAHCYRMLGSIHDAEDLVQEVYLRAWRAFDSYDERRASVRTWLYRIATNACLTALTQRARRPLPAGLGHPSTDSSGALERDFDVPWLQPVPDSLLRAQPNDPATIVIDRRSVRLALVAALQYLPPRQRAVLILREVLAWSADETALVLGTSAAAVNSALQRARAQLTRVGPVEDDLTEPDAAGQRVILDRYVAAFETSDVAALEKLLRDDVELEMPPVLIWFAGRAAVTGFFTSRVSRPADWRAVPTSANGQPAAAAYLRRPDGVMAAHSIHVLTVRDGALARIVAFQGADLFVTFGLPTTLP